MAANHVVHLIDDDDGVRGSLAFLLSAHGLPVRVYEGAEQFLAGLASVQSGCIVSDVRMPGLDGLGLMRKLRELGCPLPVVLITGHGDVPLAVEAMKEGAVDFIEKPFSDDTLLAAIEIAMRRLQSDGVAGGDAAEIRQRLQALSSREREVLEGLVAGLPNKTIAFDLGLSPRTVEVHRANVMTKMRAGSLSELVRMAMTAGGLTSR